MLNSDGEHGKQLLNISMLALPLWARQHACSQLKAPLRQNHRAATIDTLVILSTHP